MTRNLLFVLLGVALGGCTFSWTVSNGFVRQLDTSWIVPGKTTRAEIVDRLGRPPALTSVKGVRGGTGGALGALLGRGGEGGGIAAVGMNAEGEGEGAAARMFRWYCGDANLRMFEGGWYVYPTFSDRHHQRGHDILVLFDDRDVVRLLSRTEMDGQRVRLLEWKEAPR